MPDKTANGPFARAKIRIAPRPAPRAKHVLPRSEGAGNGRPDGRLRPGLDATAVSAKAREGSIGRNKGETTAPVRPRRSGRFSGTLKEAKISAEARHDAIAQKKASDAKEERKDRERQKLEESKWNLSRSHLAPVKEAGRLKQMALSESGRTRPFSVSIIRVIRCFGIRWTKMERK